MKVLEEVQIVKFLPGRTITDSSLANFIQKSTSSIIPSSSGRFSFTYYQIGNPQKINLILSSNVYVEAKQVS